MPDCGALSCLLCHQEVSFLVAGWKRRFYSCPHCELRFVDPIQWPSPEEEVARYRLHQNREDDAGYVRFLSPALEALQEHMCGGSVLDYGCGPDQVLVTMLKRAGYITAGYDPNFIGGIGLGDLCAMPDASFDGVVATEVFEHFRDPAVELDQMVRLLKPRGVLVAMTGLVDETTRMESWAYANDKTHLLFYSVGTFRYIARRWGFDWLGLTHRRVVTLRRQA